MSPTAALDISAAVTLLDASVYDPGGFPEPQSGTLVRPFLSLKSTIYAGSFSDNGVDRRVAVKFWRGTDRHVENQVRVLPRRGLGRS